MLLTTMVESCRKAKPLLRCVCLSLMRRTFDGDKVANGAKADKMESREVWGPRFLSIRASGRTEERRCSVRFRSSTVYYTILIFHDSIHNRTDLSWDAKKRLRCLLSLAASACCVDCPEMTAGAQEWKGVGKGNRPWAPSFWRPRDRSLCNRGNFSSASEEKNTRMMLSCY